MEICADCGKEIGMLEASYYRRGPADNIGKSFHANCGDPFGGNAKDAEIQRLRHDRLDCQLVMDSQQSEIESLRQRIAELEMQETQA